MIAASAVHTTGVNWESIAVIAGVVAGIIGGFAKWFISALQKGRKEQSEVIMSQVKVMVDAQFEQTKLITSALEHRLTAVDTHLDQQDLIQTAQGQDLARIQGMLTRRPTDNDKDSNG
jgi:hypothetical protein